MALTVLWGPEEHVKDRSSRLFGQICADVNEITSREKTSEEEPGEVVVRISRVIVADLQDLLSLLHLAVQSSMTEIESAIFHKQYQSLSDKATNTYEEISRLKFEILSISSTISETQNVFKAISKRDVIIRAPFTLQDSDVPPFSTDQRIWIEDLLMRTRSLKAQRNSLEQEVRILYERLESLENRRQTAAQMRFAAIASILLLPALVVGFFGQNFNVNPWTESPLAWEISAGLLAALAISQWFYFKIKKWF
jgi:Mg2+ and Co2+ transporter CorA